VVTATHRSTITVKKICTGRDKAIWIIGFPDSQCPDKGSSTVNAFVSCISITIYVSSTYSKHTFSLTDTATTTENQLAIFFLNNASNDNLTTCYNISGLRVYWGKRGTKLHSLYVMRRHTLPAALIGYVTDGCDATKCVDMLQ
jgi:hypothetical protein